MKLTKLKADRNIISVKKLITIVHPMHRSIFTDRFNESIDNSRDFRLEHRYVPTHSDNEEERYCKTVMSPHNSSSGIVYYGTIQDITEERMASMAVLKIQEEERERISKELHDNIGQKLSASSIFMNMDDFDRVKVKQLVDESITIIRNISHVLTTSNLEDSTFGEAVEFLIDSTPISDKIHFSCDVDEELIPKFTGGQLYRVIQEALSNATKYSQASEVKLLVQEKNSILTLQYSDNGIGFDTVSTKLGNGVRNMKERVRYCNGELVLESKPNTGTIINIKIPLYEKEYNASG